MSPHNINKTSLYFFSAESRAPSEIFVQRAKFTLPATHECIPLTAGSFSLLIDSSLYYSRVIPRAQGATKGLGPLLLLTLALLSEEVGLEMFFRSALVEFRLGFHAEKGHEPLKLHSSSVQFGLSR